ncbi:MAG: PhoPQ-activated protein PqaA family protein [Fimbriimonadaceae bacterium]
MIAALSLAVAGAMAQSSVPPELGAFLRRPDPTFSYRVLETQGNRIEIRLASQTWQGILWEHSVALIRPSSLRAEGIAVLYITGDRRPADIATASLLAESARLPVAVLFDIPNQPIWGMREDDLIAHTFEKFLETRDPSWPLLFPMTKAALRAMDAVERHSAETDNPIRRFVVAGASKRGWTTWLVGASGDRRVVGLAPMVYDNLNIDRQLRHHLVSWGRYSPMIQDYTRRGLQARMETPLGRRLTRMVDPHSYLDRIRVPVLVVNGANDPYWPTDALSLYVDDLRMPNWSVVVPNAGHELGNGRMAFESIRAFAISRAGQMRMPNVRWDIDWPKNRTAPTLRVQSSGLPVRAVQFWVAESDSLDFGASRWQAEAQRLLDPAQTRPLDLTLALDRSLERHTAVMGEVRYRFEDVEFSLTSPVRVFRSRARSTSAASTGR